ncbi:hypothetical protein OH799_22375 [Nocardia sp. NBC_00881]|uniref:hypothetical protein n=1 Tax=Nocardia sp. NBC_00881 TaxID=2975995 RepID=UPI0038634864|nr:hypothetical protein OH799_22375 [Nocardia sp. NBC_00881]
MTLMKKGSRRIIVDGVTYRWRLRPRPTYDQGIGSSPCIYAVVHAEHPGSTLVVKTGHAHPSNWVDMPPVPVRPADVPAGIRIGLTRGWNPTSPGKPFILDCSGKFVAL